MDWVEGVGRFGRWELWAWVCGVGLGRKISWSLGK